MTEGENKAIEYLKENSLVRLNENNEIVAYGNAHKYYIINFIEKLKKENEELKNKVAKRNNELIELDETSEKEFLTKQEVKENYIPKDKIREKLERLENQKENYKEHPLVYMLLKNQYKELLEEKQEQ